MGEDQKEGKIFKWRKPAEPLKTPPPVFTILCNKKVDQYIWIRTLDTLLASYRKEMERRIAFDLDETLGVPLIADNSLIVGFHFRPGCRELLARLQSEFTLCLWTVSHRRYLDKALAFGLADYFKETYSWDENPCAWKDVRKLQVEYLIDDSPDHREAARKHGLADRYIVVPAFGSREDNSDPLLWARLIENVLWTPR